MTKWQKRLETIQRAQQRAQHTIEGLATEGYEVSEDLRKLAYDPVTGHKTEKQKQAYLNLLQTSRIKARAKKSIAMSPFIGHQNVQNVPRFTDKIKVRKGHEVDDIANQLYKSLKYSLKKDTLGKSRSMALSIKNIFMMMGGKSLSSYEKFSARQMDKFFRGIPKKKFIEAFKVNYDESLMHMVDVYYMHGLTSPKARESRYKVLLEAAKETFKEWHTDFSEQDVNDLYEYFKHSPVWSKFRNDPKYQELEDYEKNDLMKEIVNGKRRGVDVDAILTKHDNITDSLNEILSIIAKG